jgi:hypothetical protein
MTVFTSICSSDVPDRERTPVASWVLGLVSGGDPEVL